MKRHVANKKVIFAMGLLALSGVTRTVYAQSTVTLYGVVEEELEYANSTTSLGSNSGGQSRLAMTTASWRASRFGLRGNEDIGNGTSVIFDLQAGFNPNNGAASTSGLLFNRYAFVGLANKRYGTVTVGRQYTPYLLLQTQYQAPIWLSGSFGARPGDIDAQDASFRVNNEIIYVSPTVSGVTVGASYSVPGVAGSVMQGATWSGAIRYVNGPFGASAGVLRINNPTYGGGLWSGDTSTQPVVSAVNNGYKTAAGQQRVNFGLGYSLSEHWDVAANYSNTEYIPGGNSFYRDTAIFNSYGAVVHWQATPAASFAVGYTYVKVARANGITHAASYQQLSTSEVYSLSKRTSLFFLQAVQRAHGQTLGTNGTGNIINATATLGDGFNSLPSSTATQIGFTLGISHSF